ncbi:MAG: glycosyltransferase family 4 protein [Microbacter sp.]
MLYRIPIFNLLAQQDEIELTVMHSGKQIRDTNKIYFQEKEWVTYSLSKIVLYKHGLYAYLQSFDVVIVSYELRRLSLMLLPFYRNRSFKIIFWGIGVRGSYKHRLGANTKWDILRFYLAKHADALLFYSAYPIPIYEKKGFDAAKLFVANNSVEVSEKFSNALFTRNRIIFVGSLYKEKRIFELLHAYQRVFERNASVPCLDIIGDGVEKEAILQFIDQHNLSAKISLHGAVYDEEKLEALYRHALVSISPDQAGLSVLKSMAYGVPFITHKNAITGGERLNIKQHFNGVLFNDFSEIETIIEDVMMHPDRYQTMGMNAQKYYKEHASPAQMVQGFMDAIFYVVNLKDHVHH